MKDDFNVNFGIYIRKRRERLELTQQDVANAIGVDRSTYAHYEVGDRVLTAPTLYKITKVLKFDVTSFYDYYELNQKKK